MKSLSAGLLLILFSNLACSSSTVDETKDFISDKAEACEPYGFSSTRGDIKSEYNNARVDINFEDDSIIVTEKFTRLDFDTAKKIYLVEEQVEYRSESAIGDLDPQVGADQGVMILKCAESKCFEVSERSRITGYQWGGSGENDFRPGDGPWGKFVVRNFSIQHYPLCDADTAIHVKEALTHLIKQSAQNI